MSDEPEMFTEHGHKAEVQADRNRVVCTECPWFHWMPGEKKEAMYASARRHKNATTLR